MTLLVPITILIVYWLLKLIFIRRSSINYIRLSKRYTENILHILPLVFVLKPLINIIIIGLAEQRADIVEAVMLGVGVASLLLPK